MEHGNYLNAREDSLDYAGNFNIKDIKNTKVKVRIKSYRDEEDIYSVNLTFADSGQKLIWDIDSSETVSYLPSSVELQNCESIR